jgi:UDP-N-acetylmuramoylalanine--D-glutamate ligase
MGTTPSVGVVGAGRSGIAAAKFLDRLGERVLLSDREKVRAVLPARIAVESGRHSDRLLSCRLLIRSPGVPAQLPVLQKARGLGRSIWSELELASRFVKAQTLVAITGTNGKTTTTTLVGELFKTTGRPTFVGGNIGTPLSDFVFQTTPPSNVVLEVSSYQLEDIHSFHPHLSAILNVTPDHLEHHGTMKCYAEAKARIFENQTQDDVAVLNADDAWCRRLAQHCPARVFFFSRTHTLKRGIFMDGGDLVLRWGSVRARWRYHSLLPGAHNVENVLASVALAVAGGVPLAQIRRVVARFTGVEHRLENVRRLHGVSYVNDSKGTNVDSTRVALQSFEKPMIVIMGGRGKGAPYTPLCELIRTRVKTLLLIGEDARRIEKEFKGLVAIESLQTLDKAVKRSSEIASAGDVVLLSPACASFDQYRNYEERGRHFKSLVQPLR